jgi:hypothetical protein
MAQGLQWQNVTADFSGANQAGANAQQGFANAGNVFQGLAKQFTAQSELSEKERKERYELMARELNNNAFNDSIIDGKFDYDTYQNNLNAGRDNLLKSGDVHPYYAKEFLGQIDTTGATLQGLQGNRLVENEAYRRQEVERDRTLARETTENAAIGETIAGTLKGMNWNQNTGVWNNEKLRKNLEEASNELKAKGYSEKRVGLIMGHTNKALGDTYERYAKENNEDSNKPKYMISAFRGDLLKYGRFDSNQIEKEITKVTEQLKTSSDSYERRLLQGRLDGLDMLSVIVADPKTGYTPTPRQLELAAKYGYDQTDPNAWNRLADHIYAEATGDTESFTAPYQKKILGKEAAIVNDGETAAKALEDFVGKYNPADKDEVFDNFQTLVNKLQMDTGKAVALEPMVNLYMNLLRKEKPLFDFGMVDATKDSYFKKQLKQVVDGEVLAGDDGKFHLYQKGKRGSKEHEIHDNQFFNKHIGNNYFRQQNYANK